MPAGRPAPCHPSRPHVTADAPALPLPAPPQVWEKDEPEAAAPEAEEEAAGTANGSAGGRETMEVVVSDMTDANGMYVQVRGTGHACGCAKRCEVNWTCLSPRKT